jgi:type VI secretion system protein ImpB
MDDFSPAAIAKKIEPLRKLLEARTQLTNLLSYMDGKSKAEDLLSNVLKDPALLQALASAPAPKAASEEAK